MIIERPYRETCGDPTFGEACEFGVWYGRCEDPRCEGMCQYKSLCACEGCNRPDCCAYAEHQQWVLDLRVGRHIRRPIEQGPPVP